MRHDGTAEDQQPGACEQKQSRISHTLQRAHFRFPTTSILLRPTSPSHHANEPRCAREPSPTPLTSPSHSSSSPSSPSSSSSSSLSSAPPPSPTSTSSVCMALRRSRARCSSCLASCCTGLAPLAFSCARNAAILSASLGLKSTPSRFSPTHSMLRSTAAEKARTWRRSFSALVDCREWGRA